MIEDARIPQVEGYVSALVDMKSQLLIEDEELKERQAMHEPMTVLMEHLSDKVVSQSKGIYSELLTAIVLDVMDDKDQQIELDATMSAKSRPEVVISSIKKGVKEDIVRDRGGSINNLVSAGLRIIALALSGNRRFVILDEADCWLRGDLVPKFSEVLGRLSTEMGIQCIYISHHDPDIFRAHGDVVDLFKNGGSISYRLLPSHNKNEPEVVHHRLNGDLIDSHIASISLDNIANFKNFHLPIGPGLTVLAGENDLGKSTIVQAIEALITGNNSSHLITHGESIGHVSVGLEGGHQLSFALTARKGGKPLYTLSDIDSNVVKTEEIKRTDSAPDWVQSILAMPLTGGLNLHVGSQKDPLFILNPAYSPQKRAELIDLGESYYQFSLLSEQFARDQRDCKQRRGQIAKELDKLNDKLELYRPIDMAKNLAEKLSAIAQWKLKAQQEVASINAFVEEIEIGVDLIDEIEAIDRLLRDRHRDSDSILTLHELSELIDADLEDELLNAICLHKMRQPEGSSAELLKSATQIGELRRYAAALEPDFAQEDVLHLLVDKAAVLASQICGLGSIEKEVRDVLMMANLLEDGEIYKKLHTQIKELSNSSGAMYQNDPLAVATNLVALTAEIEEYRTGLVQDHHELEHLSEHKAALLDENDGVCPVCQTMALGRVF